MTIKAFDAAKVADLKKEISVLNEKYTETANEILNMTDTGSVDMTEFTVKAEQNSIREKSLNKLNKELAELESADPEKVAVKKASATDQDLAFSEYCRRSDHAPSSIMTAEGFENFRSESDSAVFVFKHAPAKSILNTPNSLRSDDATGNQALQVHTEMGNPTEALKAYGGAREMCAQFDTADGNKWEIPQSNQTDKKGVWVGNQSVEAVVNKMNNFTKIAFGSNSGNSGIIPVSMQAIRDIVFPVESYVTDQAVERIGRNENDTFTNGTSTSGVTITGLFEKIESVVTTSANDTIDLENVRDLIYSIDPAYLKLPVEGPDGTSKSAAKLNGGKVGFMVAYLAEKILYSIEDGDGRPMWQPSLLPGVPNRIFGYDVHVNHDMAAPAAGTKSVAFGNFSEYKIRNIEGMKVYRIFDGTTIKFNEVHFLAWHDCDAQHAGPLDASGNSECMKALTMGA